MIGIAGAIVKVKKIVKKTSTGKTTSLYLRSPESLHSATRKFRIRRHTTWQTAYDIKQIAWIWSQALRLHFTKGFDGHNDEIMSLNVVMTDWFWMLLHCLSTLEGRRRIDVASIDTSIDPTLATLTKDKLRKEYLSSILCAYAACKIGKATPRHAVTTTRCASKRRL